MNEAQKQIEKINSTFPAVYGGILKTMLESKKSRVLTAFFNILLSITANKQILNVALVGVRSTPNNTYCKDEY